jgi:sulfatase modifying factor 1
MFRVQTLLLDAALLTTACGQTAASPCDSRSGPQEGADSATLQAQAAASPSCLAGGPGLSDCGPAKESCCTSLPVPGGTFYRTYTSDGCNATAEADPATVSSFRLDKYDVTVGRFRQFANAWSSGWRPAVGSGKHTHLNGGQGLVNSLPEGGYEPGWSTFTSIFGTKVSYDFFVAPTTAHLTSCSGGNLTTDLQFIPYSCNTWTDTPGTQENQPIVCVNWYEAYAFCIWDGGFLPSEAEWEYAAAGGSQQRLYPWGSADPGTANRYAIYHCNYPTPALVCTGAFEIAPVGTPTLGAGRWGQLDLAGNVWQLTLDDYIPYTACIDCAPLGTVPFSHIFKGGSFESDTPALLLPTYDPDLTSGRYDTGLRCARTP